MRMDVLATYLCTYVCSAHGVTGGYEPSCECWESKPSPLEEQPVSCFSRLLFCFIYLLLSPTSAVHMRKFLWLII